MTPSPRPNTPPTRKTTFTHQPGHRPQQPRPKGPALGRRALGGLAPRAPRPALPRPGGNGWRGELERGRAAAPVFRPRPPQARGAGGDGRGEHGGGGMGVDSQSAEWSLVAASTTLIPMNDNTTAKTGHGQCGPPDGRGDPRDDPFEPARDVHPVHRAPPRHHLVLRSGACVRLRWRGGRCAFGSGGNWCCPCPCPPLFKQKKKTI